MEPRRTTTSSALVSHLLDSTFLSQLLSSHGNFGEEQDSAQELDPDLLDFLLDVLYVFHTFDLWLQKCRRPRLYPPSAASSSSSSSSSPRTTMPIPPLPDQEQTVQILLGRRVRSDTEEETEWKSHLLFLVLGKDGKKKCTWDQHMIVLYRNASARAIKDYVWKKFINGCWFDQGLDRVVVLEDLEALVEGFGRRVEGSVRDEIEQRTQQQDQQSRPQHSGSAPSEHIGDERGRRGEVQARGHLDPPASTAGAAEDSVPVENVHVRPPEDLLWWQEIAWGLLWIPMYYNDDCKR